MSSRQADTTVALPGAERALPHMACDAMVVDHDMQHGPSSLHGVTCESALTHLDAIVVPFPSSQNGMLCYPAVYPATERRPLLLAIPVFADMYVLTSQF